MKFFAGKSPVNLRGKSGDITCLGETDAEGVARSSAVRRLSRPCPARCRYPYLDVLSLTPYRRSTRWMPMIFTDIYQGGKFPDAFVPAAAGPLRAWSGPHGDVLGIECRRARDVLCRKGKSTERCPLGCVTERSEGITCSNDL